MTPTPLGSRCVRLAALLVTFCAASAGWAADASKLGAELTPLGAEKAGTASGIPVWAPVEPQGPGWTYGKRRADFWRHNGDKPLYSVNAGNADKYADKLSAGQLALLKDVKGYAMDVYPSRRSCGAPDFVAENTKKNVGFAKMGSDGVSLEEAYTPGIPFPLPQSGAEVMWNMKMRYRGVGLEMRNVLSTVSPRKGNAEWIRLGFDQHLFFPWGQKATSTFSKVDRTEAAVYFLINTPTALAGQAAISTSWAGKPMETFYYFPGQRRVRRMPAYAYDSPQLGYENQYAVDEQYGYSGPLDRFEWKLLGKKEMLVPYNSFAMYDFSAKVEDVAQPEFVAAASRRYELHRVWVVEANVKSGMRHFAAKRLFYIDEDSWNLVMAVDFDNQGKVWKQRETFSMPVYETGTCDELAIAQYNLSEGRYLIDGTPVGAGSDVKWVVDPAGNARMRGEFFTSDNLRSISER